MCANKSSLERPGREGFQVDRSRVRIFEIFHIRLSDDMLGISVFDFVKDIVDVMQFCCIGIIY